MNLQVQRTMKRWTNLSTLNHLPTSTLARLSRELDRTWTQAHRRGSGVQGAASPHQGILGIWHSERGNSLAEAATRNSLPLSPQSPHTPPALIPKAHCHSAGALSRLEDQLKSA
jgi:hypothetical protein